MLSVKKVGCTVGRPANSVDGDPKHRFVHILSHPCIACASPMHVISLNTPSPVNPTPKFIVVQAHQAITLHIMCQKMVPLIALSL